MAIDIKNALELKGGVNGLKFILGAALIVLANQMAMIQQLVPLFPDAGWLKSALEYIAIAMNFASDPVSILGHLGMWGGLLHKLYKLVR